MPEICWSCTPHGRGRNRRYIVYATWDGDGQHCWHQAFLHWEIFHDVSAGLFYVFEARLAKIIADVEESACQQF